MKIHYLSAMIAALTCASLAWAGDKPTYLGDSSRSGGTAEPITLEEADDLTLCYEQAILPDGIFASPVVMGDNLLLASEGGDIVNLKLGTGTTRWSISVGERVLATPTIADGRVLVGTTGGRLLALSLEDGSTLWEIHHGGFQDSSVNVSGNTVVLSPGAGNSFLLAYDLRDGSPMWSTQLERYAQATTAIADDRIIVVQPSGAIAAFDLATGNPTWDNIYYSGGLFYGASPVIVENNGTHYAYTAPGGEVRLSGSALSGYQNYPIYRLNVGNGQAESIVPGRPGAVIAAQRTEGSEETTTFTRSDRRLEAPADLLEQLNSLSHLESQLKLVEAYEAQMGVELPRVKDQLRAIAARAEADAQFMADLKRVTNSTPSGGALPVSNFASNWPTANAIRPSSVALLDRGTNNFMAVIMRETPATSITPRTILFSINGDTGGELFWHYASDSLEVPAMPRAQTPLLLPKRNDTNGAYLLAPLGRCIGIFDAATGNVPNFQIDMPGVIFASPVLANGFLTVVDTSGYIKVFKSDNSAPTASVIVAPAAGSDVRADGGEVELSWIAAQDSEEASANLSYELQYAINDSVSLVPHTLAIGATTNYTLSGLAADSRVQYRVRATDSNGAAGPYSQIREFYYKRDMTAPAVPNTVIATGGPLTITVNFDPSDDEAPTGAADVAIYRLTVTSQADGSSFSLETPPGPPHRFEISGNNPATPLSVGVTYTLRLVAIDRRGNTSSTITRAATVAEASGEDTFPPFVRTATIVDSNRDGLVDLLQLIMNENITTGGLSIGGFFLNGTPAIGVAEVAGKMLTLSFGAGIEGTGIFSLSYDAQLGSVRDDAGNAMSSFANGIVSVTDSAAPVLLRDSLVAIDDNSDGHPDRIIGRFSERVTANSLELADFRMLRDAQGNVLTASAVRLLADGMTIELTLSGDVGVPGRPTLELTDNGNGNFVQDESGITAIADVANLPPQIVVTPVAGDRIFGPGVLRFDASSSSDPEGEASESLFYTWRIESFGVNSAPSFLPGSLSVRNGAGLNNVEIAASEAGVYGMRVIVADSSGAQAEQFITFTIRNEAPRIAMPKSMDTKRVAEVLRLKATSVHDPNSSLNSQDIVLQEWSFVSGPSDASLQLVDNGDGSADIEPSDLELGTYTFQLTVMDSRSIASTATMDLRVYDEAALPPMANAGRDRTVRLGQDIALNGQFSRGIEGTNHNWIALTSGATLSDADSARAVASVLSVGTYTFRLTLSDGTFSSSDEVTITVFDPDTGYVPSLTIAAPSRAMAGDPFVIDASDSVDVESPVLSFDIIQRAGPQVDLSVTENGVWRAVGLATGEAVFAVTVSDGAYRSPEQLIRVIVESDTAHAPSLRISAPNRVVPGEAALLNLAESSDSDGDDLTPDIRLISGPAPIDWSILEDGNVEVVAPLRGSYQLEVRLSDSELTSEAQIIEMNALGASEALPNAIPQASRQSFAVNESRVATLSVSASNATNVEWIQVAGPAALIVDANATDTEITLPATAGSYSFELMVDDGEIQRSAGLVTLSVSDVPEGASSVRALNNDGGCSLSGGGGIAALAGMLAMLVALVFFVGLRRRGVTE